MNRTLSSLAIALAGTLSACTGSQGPAGQASAVRTALEAAGAHCATGGLRVEVGADANGNGRLDDAEVASTAYVCDGAVGPGVTASTEPPGATCAEGGVRLTPTAGAALVVCHGATGAAGASVTVSAEPPGASCADGGQRLQVGAGTPAYVCHGAAGADGLSVTVTSEPPGAACAFGGQRLQVGAAAPTYACNGAPGADGLSVSVTPEPPGAACAFGGQRLQVGGGTPSYVCDGAAGADGLSVTVTPEPAGGNCTYGGQRLQVGAASPTFVCDGAPGADGLSVTVTAEPPGLACPTGGQRLQVGAGPVSYACNGADGLSVTLEPVPPGATCAFGGVSLRVGTGLASVLCSGAPAGVTLPTVSAAAAGPVRYREATVSAQVTGDGGELVLARGVVVADHPTPTDADAVVLAGAGAGAFSAAVAGLAPATTYWVRAFAVNALGTAYGAEATFTTLALTVPAVTTGSVDAIAQRTAVVHAGVPDDGGLDVLERGVCWGTAPAPALGGSCAAEGPGAGPFLAMATGLAPATGYHVRAYATNALGTGYGEDLAFTTAAPPLATVTTAAPTAVTFSAATGGGAVLDDAGAPVTSRGVCWSTAPAPTTAGTCAAQAAGLGAFTLPMTGLAPGTGYHVRAFAVNAGGTSYGADLAFTTPAATAPALSTKAVNGISSNLAGSGGVIASDGGSPITAKGVCWSLNPNPSTANSRTVDGAGPADFNSTLTGLAPLTTYHVRAYATNALGTAYGQDLTFTTTDLVAPGPGLPVVGTATSTITGSTTASSGGYVSSDGGSAVTARGVCWSTAPNPTVADACSTDGGAGVGAFTATVTGLGGCGVVYYVRAFATNSTGTAYGNQNSVSTGLLPTVATAAVTAITTTGATSGGDVTDDGGCPVTARGVAYGWSAGPVATGPHTTDGTGAGSFASTVTGLYSNRTYYLRAYATNQVGTTYGAELAFSTLEPATPYLGQRYAGGMVFYVDGTGLHGLVVSLTDLSGPWGCQGTPIPTSLAFGSGPTNTAAIVASCAQAGTAARLADDLVQDGYSDWFLPSRDEMSLAITNLGLKGLGGLSEWTRYWTSSEFDATQAWFAMYFYGSLQPSRMDKSYGFPFRPVRAF